MTNATQGTRIATRGKGALTPAQLSGVVDSLVEQISPLVAPDALSRVARETLVAACASKAWRDALEQGGVAAIAKAITLCVDNDLKAHRDVYLMPLKDGWDAQINAYGYARIATRARVGGRPLYAGYQILGEEERERNGKTYVIVRVRVRRLDGGFADGVGRKPRHQTIGVWEGPRDDRRKVGEREEYDYDAESKAETQAFRRACEKLFPGVMPDYEGEIVDVEVEDDVPLINQPDVDAAVPEQDPAGDYAEMRPTDMSRTDPSVKAGQQTILADQPEEEEKEEDAEAKLRAANIERLYTAGDEALAGGQAFEAYMGGKLRMIDPKLADMPLTEALREAPTNAIGAWADELARAATSRRRNRKEG